MIEKRIGQKKRIGLKNRIGLKRNFIKRISKKRRVALKIISLEVIGLKTDLKNNSFLLKIGNL